MRKWLKLLNNKFDVFTRTLPESVRPKTNEVLGWGKAVASMAANHHVCLYTLPLQGEADKGDVAYLGPGTNLKFVAHQVGSSLSEFYPEWKAPVWQLSKAIKQAQKNYDGLVLELPHRILNSLSLTNGIFTLPYLRWRVKTDGDWETIEGGFHSDARRDLRKSDEITCTTTREEKDLHFFYHEIYHPYILQNFGELAQPTSLEILHYYFQRGWLVFAKDQTGRVVGASLCFIINDIMYDYVGATVLDLDRRTQRGVTANYFVHMMRLAWEEGCSALDLGLARPLLDDGIARYKRKWGAYVIADQTQNWGLWLNVGANPIRMTEFLALHPWMWLDEAGRLKGFVVDCSDTPLDTVRVRRICKPFWVQGIHSILLCAPNGFEPDIPLVDSPIPELGPTTEWDIEMYK